MNSGRILSEVFHRLYNLCIDLGKRKITTKVIHSDIFIRFITFYLILFVIAFAYITCFDNEPHSINYQLSMRQHCQQYEYINSFIWTYDGTGLMKYIQWIITRKLGNIRITRLNNYCDIIEENNFLLNSTNNIFTQVYILSFSMDLTNQSKCSIRINQLLKMSKKYSNQIYFKRKSIEAMFVYEYLDKNLNIITNSSETIKNMNYIIKYFSNYFISNKWLIINSEDLIHENLFDCEKALIHFFTSIQLNISIQILQYDVHHFLEDSTWWDQSEVAERILNMSIPSRPLNLTYINDFYHLHGSRSFVQYLFDSRQCFNAGIFAQLPSETISNNHRSIDEPNRCLSKSFDCAFSDIYSFHDREELYQHSHRHKSLKCGFIISTIFDEIRNRYNRNQTCQTIIVTLITDCYYPLPIVRGTILPSFCFVALLDTQTVNAYKTFYVNHPEILHIDWDVIDLGTNATPFSIPAKSIETLKTLSQRMFPLAKWIIWLDGKAHITNIGEILLEAQAPVIGVYHADVNRTSESEVHDISLQDIELQQKEYQRDGFYSRFKALQLKIYDTVIFIYRNNHPCILRYLCGWHNEINYYSYRGQLSVYYPAVRLNLTDYLQFLPERFYLLDTHHPVC